MKWFLITLILFSLLPQCLFAQQKIILSDTEGVGYHLFVNPELIYKNSRSSTEISIPLRDLPDGVLPVENPDYAVLRYTFQIPASHTFFTPSGNKENLRIEIKTDGSFSFNETKNLRLSKNTNYKGFVDIPLPRQGSGTVTLIIRDLEGKAFAADAANTTTFSLTVYSISDASHVTQLSDNSVVNQRYFVLQHIKALDAFKHFRDARFSELDAYNGIGITLSNVENSLKRLYTRLNRGTTPGQIIDFYKVFGQRELSQHPITRSMHEEAIQKIRQADQNFTKETPTSIDLKGVRDRQNEYRILFCNIPGYSCLNEAYFQELIDLLATDNTCAELAQSYKRVSNINTLLSIYRKCQEKNCKESTCLEIKARIELVECQDDLEQAKNELNIEEKRSQLNLIINKASCSAVVAEATNIFNSIPELQLTQGQSIAPIATKDPNTGRKLLSFTITFDKGKGIEIKTIDTVAVDAFPDYHSHKWTERDKSVTIVLEDRATPYEVVFWSTVTKEEVSIPLSKEQFKALINEEKSAYRIITLENGTPPYFARFSNTESDQSFTVRLNAPIDTLFLNNLSENYQGEYELTILDNYGRSGLDNSHALVLINDSWPLWLKLLIPLILLSGFLIYRNLPLTDQE